MLHFQPTPTYKPTADQTYSQQGSILPISNSIRSGRGISISMSGRSKGEKSNSRENRKPIFQKNTSFNSSEGFNTFKTLDRKQSNKTDIDSKHHNHQENRRDSPPMEHVVTKSTEETEKESDQAKQYCNNLLNLMKEQLEISITSTQTRMNEQIRKNNEQLLRLESKLKQNELLLSAKEQEIVGLREKLDRTIINKVNPNAKQNTYDVEASQFNKNFEYMVSRLRDVEVKVRTITNESSSQSNMRETLVIYKLQQKVDSLSTFLCRLTNQKIQDITKGIQTSFSRKIDELDSKALLLLQKQSSLQQSTHKHQQMQKRLSLLHTEFKNLLKASQTKSSKQIKYDNTQLKSLKTKVESVLYSVNQFQNQKCQVNQYLKEIQIQHSSLVQQIKQRHYNLRKQEERLSFELSKSQGKRKSPGASTNNENISTNNLRLANSKPPSERQHFEETSYFDQEESVLDQPPPSPQSPVLKRLIETIRKTKYSTPLLCEVDQTGYLKYSKLGTYLFDTEGNLFQLSKNEMTQAINSKIIKLP